MVQHHARQHRPTKPATPLLPSLSAYFIRRATSKWTVGYDVLFQSSPLLCHTFLCCGLCLCGAVFRSNTDCAERKLLDGPHLVRRQSSVVYDYDASRQSHSGVCLRELFLRQSNENVHSLFCADRFALRNRQFSSLLSAEDYVRVADCGVHSESGRKRLSADHSLARIQSISNRRTGVRLIGDDNYLDNLWSGGI